MHSTLAVRALRSIHPPSAAFRTASAARATPLMFAGAAARPALASSVNMGAGAMGKGMSPTMMMARRWNTQENKGGRAKLIFRFGLRDIPVELYPMAFVVAVACVGAAFAVGRHFYLDGLRTGPAGKTATTE